ncbi:Glutamate receptor, ionotropic kainate 2 [Camponotus floridanus]|uniref:Glutamate receptor, ionotropic kainate 2 n=1 Tax=Camponotus floridanus TaxID=104421 RepID=E2A5B7_CAMFO|nr:Glutamate receptor, ionotropic kainate 2 [Camponotus floridanus]
MNGRSQIAPGPVPTKLHPEFQYSAYHISTLKRRQHRPGITLRLLCPCKPTLPTDYRDSDCVCHLLRGGVAAIFGPQSAHTASHVQSICDTMEIPHLETRWDYRLRRQSCLVNLYPHPTTLSKKVV